MRSHCCATSTPRASSGCATPCAIACSTSRGDATASHAALEILAGILSSDPTLSLDQLLHDQVLFHGWVVENLVAEHYRRVGTDERPVIDALAVFDRPVPELAVRYLLLSSFPQLDVRQCLRSLVGKSAVKFHRERNAFGLHPLDQQYAYSRLPAEGAGHSRETLHRRAASYFESIPIPKSPKGLDDIESQLEARRHYYLIRDFDKAAEIAAAWTRFLLRVGQYETTDRILSESIETVRGYSLASAFLGKASISGLRNEWSRALEYNKRAIETLEGLPGEQEKNLRCVAIVNTGYAHCRLMQFEAVREVCRGGLETARQLGSPWLEGKNLSILALASLLLGDYDDVFEYGRRSLELHRPLPLQETGTASSHTADIMGMAHLAQGSYQQALALFGESLEMREALKSVFGLGHSHNNLGLVHLAMGKPEEALEHVQKSLEIRERIQHLEGIVESLCSLGSVYQAQGQQQEALEAYGRGLDMAMANKEGTGIVMVRCSIGLGSLLLEMGRPSESLEHLANAHRLAVDLSLKPEQARSACQLAACHERLGHRDVARAFAEEAIGIVRRGSCDSTGSARRCWPVETGGGARADAEHEHRRPGVQSAGRPRRTVSRRPPGTAVPAPPLRGHPHR